MSATIQQRLPFFAAPQEGNARRNLVLEAGAGTGKTTAIVREVVELLLDRKEQQLERVVLVTFTEKAAAEIAERIREALVDLHSTFDSGNPRWPSDAEKPIIRIPAERADSARMACETHLANLDRLRSQTIHSFCQSMLQMFPIEAHLSPSFRLVNGFDRDELYDEIYDSWFEQETSSGDAAVLADWRITYEQLGNLDSIREIIFDLFAKQEIVADPSYATGDISAIAEAVQQRIDQLQRLSPDDVALIEDPGQLAATQFIREHPLPAPSIEEWSSYFEELEPLLADCTFHNRRVPEAKEALQWLRNTDIYGSLKSHVAAVALRRIAVRFFETLDREKEQRSLVDFDDLLLRAARLIEIPSVLESLRQRYEFIFVDEFQDTDRVQARILQALARRSNGTFVDGRVTLVGDPKQSIYSFRRADPETYAETVREFVAGGARKQFLSDQYRSDPPLVLALNTLFERAFPSSDESDENVFRPEYTPLRPAREKMRYELPARLTFLTTCISENKIVAEAEAICRYVQKVKSASGSGYRRFAILLKSMTHLDAYVDALSRAGIPYALPPQRPFFEQKVIVQIMSVLRSIAFPFDEAARVAAMRSPCFGFSDDEILQHSRACKEGRSCPIDAAEALLREIGARSRSSTVEETIGILLGATRLRSIFELTADRSGSITLLDELLDTATEFDRTHGGSLAQFVDDIAARRRGARETQRAIPDETIDAVRVMTVHGAKGLEFETVILPDLGNDGGRDRISAFVVEHPRHLVLTGRAGTLSRFVKDAKGRTLAEIEKERSEMENGRLFYVAVTRAQSDVVFVTRDDPQKKGFWRCIARIFGAEPRDILGDCGGEEIREVSFGSSAVPIRFLNADLLPPFEPAASRPGRFRDPAVAESVAAAENALLFEREISVAAETKLDAAAVRIRLAAGDRRGFGIAVHRFFELWNGSPSKVDALIESVCRENLLGTADRHLVRDTIRRAIASESWARLSSAQDLGRELPIHFPSEDRIEERRIDRLIRIEGRLHVVDFKTGKRRGTRFDRDSEQVRRYCEIVSSIANEPCSGLLWYVDAGREELVEISS